MRYIVWFRVIRPTRPTYKRSFRVRAHIHASGPNFAKVGQRIDLQGFLAVLPRRPTLLEVGQVIDLNSINPSYLDRVLA